MISIYDRIKNKRFTNLMETSKKKKKISHHQHNNDELSSNLNEIKKSQKQSIDPSTITHKTQDLNIKRKYVHR